MGQAVIPPPPPAPPALTGDPLVDNQTYYGYMSALYTYGLEISMFEASRQNSAKMASESKKILEFCPLSGR